MALGGIAGTEPMIVMMGIFSILAIIASVLMLKNISDPVGGVNSGATYQVIIILKQELLRNVIQVGYLRFVNREVSHFFPAS